MKRLFLLLLVIVIMCNFSACFAGSSGTDETQSCKIKKITIETDPESISSEIDATSKFNIIINITHTGTLTFDDIYIVITDKSVARIIDANLTPEKKNTILNATIEVIGLNPCEIYFQNSDGSVKSETFTVFERAPMYDISLQNLEEKSYHSLDVGESFYLYVKPYYYDLTENSRSFPDDISLVVEDDPDSLKIEFLEICPTGFFLYKITSINEGYHNIIAVDYEGRHKTDYICIVVHDFSKHSDKTRYVIESGDNEFHLPSCDIVSRMSIDSRLRPNFTRRELRDAGYVPCKDCCG